MSKLSDYIKSGGALIEGNTTISNATGVVDIDLTSSQAYTIEQGAGDLTLNVISAVDARAEGLLSVKPNREYSLSYTGASVYDDGLLGSLAVYDNVSFSVLSQDDFLVSITFNNDGSKLYGLGAGSNSIYQYTLTTPFNLSTISYDNVSFDMSGQDTSAAGIIFSNEGSKLFMVGQVNDSIYQYTLTTPYDLSTISYESVSFNVSGQDTGPQDVDLKNDGSKLYLLGGREIYQYTLSTPYDLSTISYDGVSFSVEAQDTLVRAIAFKESGTKLFIVGANSYSIHQYTLTTPYDLSTTSYDNISFNYKSVDESTNAIALNDDESKFYISGFATDKIYQYTLNPLTIQTTHTYGSYPQIVSEANI